MATHAVPYEVKRKIWNRYYKGLSVGKISAETGKSRTVVRRVLEERGIHVPTRTYTKKTAVVNTPVINTPVINTAVAVSTPGDYAEYVEQTEKKQEVINPPWYIRFWSSVKRLFKG